MKIINTGLKDKNNNDIYSNHKLIRFDGEVLSIIFHKGCFVLIGGDWANPNFKENNSIYLHLWNEYCIIVE